MRIFLLPILVVILSGCEKTVNPKKQPKIKEEIVLNAHFSNKDQHYVVSLTRSIPINSKDMGRNYPLIDDAVVTLFDGTNTATFTYHSNFYTLPPSSIPLESGKTYQITAELPNGEKVYSQETFMEAVENFEANIDTSRWNTGWSNEGLLAYTFQVQWENSSADLKYFKVEVFAIRERILGNNDTIRFINRPFAVDNSKATNGKITATEVYHSEHSNLPFKQYLIAVSHISKSQFDYIKKRGIDFYDYEDNPFMEPVHFNSNIEGGLGIFALSNTLVKHIEF